MLPFIWTPALCLVTSHKVLLIGWAQLDGQVLVEFQRSPLNKLDLLGEFFNNPNSYSISSIQGDLLLDESHSLGELGKMSWLLSSIPKLQHGIPLHEHPHWASSLTMEASHPFFYELTLCQNTQKANKL